MSRIMVKSGEVPIGWTGWTTGYWFACGECGTIGKAHVGPDAEERARRGVETHEAMHAQEVTV